MVIIEGPDGAGKTTLVRQLMSQIPELRIGLRGTKNRDLLWQVTVPDTYRALAGAVDGRGPVYIWDRLFYSEMVYAPLADPPRPPMFNPSMFSHIKRVIDAIQCPVIVCLPSLDTVIANASKDHQMPGVMERIDAIYMKYLNMWDDEVFPEGALRWDYTRKDSPMQYEAIVHEIRDYIDDRRERAW